MSNKLTSWSTWRERSPCTFHYLIERLAYNLKKMERQVNELKKQIDLWHRQIEASRESTGLDHIFDTQK
jgi:hypothetical protein